MDPIGQFIERYTKEYDFYDQAGRLAAGQLESTLQEAGIRAIVTSRAKSVSRLREKCIKRHTRKPYESVNAIYHDIVDLAGVRVALYFPGERDQVDGIINSLFQLVEPKKVFPDSAQLRPEKRFSGYSAAHYRVTLREQSLQESERRYALAKIEIQVASVLMHAWSEVEHDLVYKPLSGQLSDDEYAILDQLNGLVLAGEIALERLQRAGQVRIGYAGGSFANHYDLASYLVSRASTLNDQPLSDAGLGRVDLLFALMSEVGIETADQLIPYLEALHSDFERRPLAEQVIDEILAADPSRYETYLSLRSQLDPALPSDMDARFRETGAFLAQWNELERLLHELVPQETARPAHALFREAFKLGRIDKQTMSELDDLRRLRNRMVHGVDAPSPVVLREATEGLSFITAKIRRTG
jgi:ppGpp synthetase/RelA/SpoT-type nucleotidyltranferase